MDTRIKAAANVKIDMSNVADILDIISPEIIEQFAYETNVDYRVKLLYGAVMFNMLLQLLVTESKVSQRNAHEILTKGVSCLEPGVVPGRGVKDHTSITKRLSTINCSFFERVYEHVCHMITPLYSPRTLNGLHICAVDSTIVTETCNKLAEGFHIGNKKADGGQRNHVKFTEAFDGLVVMGVAFNDDKTKQAENNALPEVIRKAAKRDSQHKNIYIIDRGLTNAKTLAVLSGQDSEAGEHTKVNFIVRIADDRRLDVVNELDCDHKEYETPDGRHVEIMEYNKARIYKSASLKPENAEYLHVRARITTEVKDSDGNVCDTQEAIVNLLSDVDGLTPCEMLDAYKMRWMVEVFFKFIKQNFDFSHIISTTANGLKVMMYMTMIAAMLVLIFGKSRQIGFRRAKWEFDNDLQKITIALLIILLGGDPSEFMRSQNIRFPKWIRDALPPKDHQLWEIVTDYQQVHSILT